MNFMVKGLIVAALLACSGQVSAKRDRSAVNADGRQEYIIKLQNPPLVHFDGDEQKLTGSTRDFQATGPAFTGDKRLRTDTGNALAYKAYLDLRFALIKNRIEQVLGETLNPNFRYYNLVNGFAVHLSPAQARQLEGVAGVHSVTLGERHKLDTFAGPDWIGAANVWNGLDGIPATRGEGVVIGVLDSGINFDHPSFADIGNDGYDHTNPLGEQLGLCADEEVLCNDKLIGIYDFTSEETKGKDVNGHGTHTSSLAAGNVLNVQFDFATSGTPKIANLTLQGVASHANIVMYKVCEDDDPETEDIDESGCGSGAILQALEQAVDDGVDVINYSLGTSSITDPWQTLTSGDTNNAEWFLLLREAGVFAALSAGNNGPAMDTIESPAIIPWAVAAAASSHDGLVGHNLDQLSGGSTPPPVGIAGPGISDGTNVALPIVHAKDFGNALCGTGPPELQATCAANTGATNPFPPGTFTGQIVVCDRGEYGRIEKGKNVLLAGAAGFILANTVENGESTVGDEHCLPAIHIGEADGNEVRNWLDSGTGHKGRIGPFGLSSNIGKADVLADFSSRGPNGRFVENVLKPNLMAPGVSILGAGVSGTTSYATISGTSMAAPHLAGAGALLMAANPSWTPAHIQSALETTATNELARDFSGDPATPFESGNGRPVLGDAANAGLYLNVTGQQFRSANPGLGGDPGQLNLAGLVESQCVSSCQFTRTVTDTQGGGNWTVSVNSDAAVQVTPAQFTLASGASQQLTIDVDVSDASLVGDWVFGEILMSNSTAPTAKLTLAVFSSGGDLPSQWQINTDQSSGFINFDLNLPVPMPQATFTGAGLVNPGRTTQTLNQDPTDDDPYDNSGGTFTVWQEVTAATLALRTRTQDSTAVDIDLFVGRDLNGNNAADEFEEICSSTSATSFENCDILRPDAGNYWILVQNWEESGPSGDPVTLVSAAINSGTDASLTATGPGITDGSSSFTVRASWDNVPALPGSEWWGAVAVGTGSSNLSNIGIIPVVFTRSAANDNQPLLMSEGRQYRRVLGPQSRLDRLVIDVPDNTTSLTVSASAEDPSRHGDLELRLYRMDFSAALASAPDVPSRPAELSMLGEALAGSVNGPVVVLEGSPLTPGRYYAVVENAGLTAAGVNVQADMAFSGVRNPNARMGWFDMRRGGASMFQGIDFSAVGNSGFMVWYSYDNQGIQTWYFAQAPIRNDRDIWTADLWRLTNDGTNQFITTIGEVSLTIISDTEMIMAYRLFGESGFDRAVPISQTNCVEVGGTPTSYSAHWYDGIGGKGGSTVLVINEVQQQVHYIYDLHGNPRWITTDGGAGPLEALQGVLEIRDNCALCAPVSPTITTIGTLSTNFSSETTGEQDLAFTLGAPIQGNIARVFGAVKLSDTQACINP